MAVKKRKRLPVKKGRVGNPPGKISRSLYPAPAHHQYFKSWIRISSSKGRAMIAGAIEEAARGNPIILDRYGRPVAAMVSLDHAALLAWLSMPGNKKLMASILKKAGM